MRAITDSDDYLNARQSRLIIGCSPSALQRLAMLGRVQVKLEEGCYPRYLRSDVERIAEQRRADRPQPAGA
jgi:hypothetical protein